MEINAVSQFQANAGTAQKKTKKEKTEQAATVIGGTGFAASANKYASKRGALMRAAETGEKTLQTMLDATNKAARFTSKNSKTATGLFAKFKQNVQMYTADILKPFKKVNSKFWKPIVNSPVIKKAANVIAVPMAFFVLVTGVRKAVETGAIAVDDVKSTIHNMAA